MNRRLTICVVLSGLMAVALSAAPFWTSKPYTEWTAKEVEKILGDSPWMRNAEVSFDPSAMQGRARMGGPGGGMGRPDVYVMWQSAEPVRKAMARAAQLKESAAASDLERQVSKIPEHHVLAVMGLPGGPGGMRMRRGAEGEQSGQQQPPSSEAQQEMQERMQSQMKESTFLEIDGSKVQADKVETVISGNERVLLFYFPKTPSLTSKNKSVVFQTSMGPLKISARFKPKDIFF